MLNDKKCANLKVNYFDKRPYLRSVNTLIIGNGIAAKCTVFYLNKIGLTDIVQVYDDTYAPACSNHSTAINCLRGTRPGLTPLGDRIIESFNSFEDFYSTQSPKGICKTVEYQTWINEETNNIKWKRRYKNFDLKSEAPHLKNRFNRALSFIKNEAYLFTPQVFFSWMDSKITCEKIQAFVIDIKIDGEYKIVTTNTNNKFKVKNLVICTSYMSKDFSTLVKDEVLKKQLEHSKPVPGSYIVFDEKNFNETQFDNSESFIFAFEKMYFIYRKEDKKIILGATSTNNTFDFSHNKKGLRKYYNDFKEEFYGVFDFPDFEKGIMYTGIRHKGQNRQPFWGEINDGIYAAWGLYKNAFTFSFSAASSISSSISMHNTL